MVEQALMLLGKAKNRQWAINMESRLCYGYYDRRGELSKAVSVEEASLKMAIAANIPGGEMVKQLHLGLARSKIGDWKGAVEALTRHGDLARQMGEPILMALASGHLGWNAYMNGDTEGGLSLMLEGLKGWEALGNPWEEVRWTCISLGSAYALTGDRERAALYYQKQHDAGRPYGYRKTNAPEISRLSALIGALESPPNWKQAVRDMRMAIKLHQTREELPQLAIDRFYLADLLHRKGDGKGAGRELDQAAAMFREMEMQWWLEMAGQLRTSIK